MKNDSRYKNGQIQKILVFGIILLFLTSVLFPAVGKQTINTVDQRSDDPWWDTDWEYRKAIHVNHSQVVSFLYDFPVLVLLNSDSDLADNAQEDGDDIVFIDSMGVQLNHEIEVFDSTSGQLITWVNLTEISAMEDTLFWMYYGNAVCGNQQNPPGVWDSSMVVRFSMKDFTSNLVQDSTSYQNDGTKKAADEPIETEGLIGKAQDFDNIDDYIKLGMNNLNLDFSGATALTFSAWINPASLRNGGQNDRNVLVDIPNNADKSAIMLFLFLGGDIRLGGRSRSLDGFQMLTIADVVTIDTWQHIAGVLDFTNKKIFLYYNGSLIGQASTVAFGSNTYISSTGGNETIGVNAMLSSTQLFDGLMDEIQISKTARNSSWIQTNYNNMKKPDTFLFVDDEEKLNYPPYEPSNPTPADGAVNVAITADLSWVGGDPDSEDTVTYDVYFGASSSPPKVADNISFTTFDPGTMAYNTMYCWRIVAWDNQGEMSIGPLWSFTTIINNPPVFGTPSPSNGSTNQPLTFTWNIPISDPEGNTFTWTIQCNNGQSNSGSSASNGTKSLSLTDLFYSTTYTVWVNATDLGGSGLYTRAWYFFTTKANQPPVFGIPSPLNGSLNQPLEFNWGIFIGDPENNLFSWSIECSNGQSNSGTGSTNGTKILALSGLLNLTTYIVWVNATDPTGSGLYTRGWYSFKTGPEPNRPPFIPSNPVPADGSVDIPIKNTILSWSGGDPDGDSVTYDVYFGLVFPLNKIKSNISVTSVSLSNLLTNTTYSWKVIAWDSQGASSEGPLWSFTTIIDKTPPIVTITSPTQGFLYVNLGNIIVRKFPILFTTLLIGRAEITVYAQDNISGIQRVEFYIDNDFKDVDTSEPYSWTWRDRGHFFSYVIKVVAYDYGGLSASAQVKVWKIL